ncbi:MAG: type I glutamate--ammonia ligase [Anaerolineaceae bacterium]
MFSTIQESLDYIQAQRIDLVDLLYCDLWGHLHHLTLTAREFSSKTMTEGVGFDGSSVGFKHVQAGDMVLKPDLATGFFDPFHQSPTLAFLCNIFEADTKEHYPFDPREIVRRVENRMITSGIADKSLWGPEFEFYIFDQVTLKNITNLSICQIESGEANWGNLVNANGYSLPDNQGYHAAPPCDNYFEIRDQIVVTLEKMGIPIKYHHHEVGGPGQSEIETPMLGITQAGDAAMLVKYAVKMVTMRAGKTATFLPKPIYGLAGSSTHYHQMLHKGGTNLFYDPQGPSLLSQTALQYIGGLLEHAPAVMAFTNPSTNSYRRLVPGFEAPIKAIFSAGNRSAAIRIPKYATLPEEVRMEFRPPDATGNPYLSMAAMLQAGLDGISRQVDPTLKGFGPINENIFDWPEERRAGIKSLPTSVESAMAALEADPDFLLEGQIFDQTLIRTWVQVKRKEVERINQRPTSFEIEEYYDC